MQLIKEIADIEFPSFLDANSIKWSHRRREGEGASLIMRYATHLCVASRSNYLMGWSRVIFNA